MNRQPKISLVTCCYNSEKTIEETIVSVLAQEYKNYEHIIVDGRSKDSTLHIVKKYEAQYEGRLRYISESDKGIYDAFNKGIKMAEGDIIGILNSDDILYSPTVFADIAKKFVDEECDVIYGDLVFADEETMMQTTRVWKAGKGSIQWGWRPPHPTFYVKKEVHDKHGYYKTHFKISADYDFMIRTLKDKTLKFGYVQKTLVKMRLGGVSTDGPKANLVSCKEIQQVLRENDMKFKWLIQISRIARVIPQKFKKK